jgi:glycosyltransferase involved in cell wall biosynthesis
MKTTKVRIYYPFFPYPPTEGSFHIAYEQVRAMSELGFQVELVFWKDGPDEMSAKLAQAYLDPFPENVARIILPGSKTEQVSDRIIRVGKSLFSSLSSPEILYYPPNLNPIFKEPVDLAIYNYGFAYSWLRRVHGREHRKVVVLHNLESDLFEERALECQNLLTSWIHFKNAKKLRAHELELSNLADELWFISPEDQIRFERRGRSRFTRLVTPGFSKNFHQRRLNHFTKMPKKSGLVLGLIGSLDFLPNEVGAIWVLENLAPRLKDRGFQGELKIVGKGASEKVKRLAQEYPFVKLTGFLPDLEEFWASLNFSLVPHLMGSGVRMKLLESLASGIPTLATPGAVVRIHPGLRQSELLLSSDSPDEWCDRIMRPDSGQVRGNLAGLPLPWDLDSKHIYSFMNEFN